jgi:hypothetical protein
MSGPHGAGMCACVCMHVHVRLTSIYECELFMHCTAGAEESGCQGGNLLTLCAGTVAGRSYKHALIA